MQRQFRTSFGLQRVKDLQTGHINVQPKVEGQHQRTLSFLDGRDITTSRVAICTWVKMDGQKSGINEKEMIRTILKEHPKISLRNAATQGELHFTAIWNFLNRKLSLYPYQLQMQKNE